MAEEFDYSYDENQDDSLSVEQGPIQPGQATTAYDSGGVEEHQAFARAAADAAYVRTMEFEADSLLLKNNAYVSRGVTKLDWNDIHVRGLIGVGGFACVCKVRVPILEDDDDEDSEFGADPASPSSNGGRSSSRRSSIGDDSSSSCGRSTCSTSDKNGAPYYALKCLNQVTVSDQHLFVTGAADLASEALILSHLEHPNIVRLYGVTKGGVSTAFQEQGGYFLLLELLRGTVLDLLRLWRKDLQTPAKAAKIPSQLERLEGMCVGVARGMEYLHEHNIIMRDIKPHNIGFDKSGNVRLFDLGLARELNTSNTTALDGRIAGVAGSYRYMAPEVALGDGCCFGSDSYSFGIFLWEILTLTKPFERIKGKIEFREKVAKHGQRPPLKGVTSPVLQALMKDCWNSKPEQRPTFSQIVQIIEAEVAAAPEELQQQGRTKAVQVRTMRENFKFLKKNLQKKVQERRRSLASTTSTTSGWEYIK